MPWYYGNHTAHGHTLCFGLTTITLTVQSCLVSKEPFSYLALWSYGNHTTHTKQVRDGNLNATGTDFVMGQAEDRTSKVSNITGTDEETNQSVTIAASRGSNASQDLADSDTHKHRKHSRHSRHLPKSPQYDCTGGIDHRMGMTGHEPLREDVATDPRANVVAFFRDPREVRLSTCQPVSQSAVCLCGRNFEGLSGV